MHELAVTQGLLKICLDEGQRHNVKKVNKINIKVGELTELVPNCISYYFDIVAKGTIVEGAQIVIEKIPVTIKCNNCEYEGVLPQGEYYCPNCKGSNYKITRGREFYLDTIEVD